MPTVDNKNISNITTLFGSNVTFFKKYCCLGIARTWKYSLAHKGKSHRTSNKKQALKVLEPSRVSQKINQNLHQNRFEIFRYNFNLFQYNRAWLFIISRTNPSRNFIKFTLFYSRKRLKQEINHFVKHLLSTLFIWRQRYFVSSEEKWLKVTQTKWGSSKPQLSLKNCITLNLVRGFLLRAS